MAVILTDETVPINDSSMVAAESRGRANAIHYGDLKALMPRAKEIPDDLSVVISSANPEGFWFPFRFSTGSVPTYTGGNSGTLGAADATNPRIDAVSLKTDNTIELTAGVAGASPAEPGFPTGNIPICFVYVRANATKIYNYDEKDTYSSEAYIYKDMRPFGNMGGGSSGGGMTLSGQTTDGNVTDGDPIALFGTVWKQANKTTDLPPVAIATAVSGSTCTAVFMGSMALTGASLGVRYYPTVGSAGLITTAGWPRIQEIACGIDSDVIFVNFSGHNLKGPSIGLICGGSGYSAVHSTLDALTRVETVGTNITTGRQACTTMHIYDGPLYSCGHIGASAYTNTVYAGSLLCGAWTAKTSFIEIRAFGECFKDPADVSGVGFQVGGIYGSSTYKDDNYKYTYSGDTWTLMTACTAAVANGQGAHLIEGYGFIIGCSAALSDYNQNNYRYNMSGDSWATRATLTTGRYYPGVLYFLGVLVDNILVHGGGVTAEEMYTNTSDSYVTKTVFASSAARAHGMGLVDNPVVNTNYNSPNLKMYNYDADTFSAFIAMGHTLYGGMSEM